MEITQILDELEFFNPGDRVAILDERTRKVYAVREIRFNSELEAYVLIADTSAPMKTLKQIEEEIKNGTSEEESTT